MPTSLKAYATDLGHRVRCYNVPMPQPCVRRQTARMTSANGRHQGSALLLTAVTATTSAIQGRLFQPGQTYSLPGRKEDSPGAPQSLLHHLDVTVAKRSGKTRYRRGWTGSRPLIGRMALLAPHLPPKEDKAGPHPSHPPLHGREHHVGEVSQACGVTAYAAS